MMNKMMKKVAMVIAAATMAIAAATITASANDGMGIDALTPNVTVQSMYAVKYVNSDCGANVRTAPTTDAKIIKCLPYNTQITAEGISSNGWYQVVVTDPVYGGTSTGYISSDLVSDYMGPAIVTPVNNDVNPQYSWITETHSYNTYREKEARGEMSHDNDTFTASVAKGYLALRSSAVTDPANEIAQIANGSMVQVQNYGEQFDYVYVPSLDMYGYVNNDYLA